MKMLWQNRSWRIRHAHAAMVGSLFIAFTGYSSWAFASTQQALIVASPGDEVAIKGPLKLEFNQEINPKFNYNLSPGVAGKWSKHKGSFGIRALIFQPSSQFDPGRIYEVKLGGMERSLSFQKLPETTVYFKIQAPAALEKISPADQAKDVKTDSTFEVRLKTANAGLRRLRLRTEPEVEVVTLPPDASDRVFRWRPKAPLRQGVNYRILLDDLKQSDPAKQRFYTSTFTTVAEPAIAEATSKDHFYQSDKITIKFGQTMQQSATSFRFDPKGTGGWLDAQTYQYSPSGLEPGKTYGYRVLKGSKSAAGGVLEADRGFQISTPGNIYVTSSSPRGGEVSLQSQVKISFDQPVDHASAESRFSISPRVGGSFRWEGNTLVFVPAKLDHQTTYTTNLSPGIQPVFGLPSVKSFSHNFTTAVQTIKLGVPYYRQQYTLSCEEAALRMALAFRGIQTSDMEIVNRVGYSPRNRDTAGNSWDNPYQMYVGNINGVMGSTGWGVYAEPIARAARSYGRGANAYTNVSANFIAAQIHAGKPVLMWGVSPNHRYDGWNTSSGFVVAPIGEHVRTVYGVAGRPDAAVGFYVHDPIYGSKYWSAGSLIANANTYGSATNQAVVVD